MKGWLVSLLLIITIAAASQPAITSFSPASAAVGTSITITGSNFSSTPSNNIVFFGGVKATVASASVTQLTVSVPVGASYAPITVLNTETNLLAYSTKKFLPIFSGGGVGFRNISFAAKADFATGANPVATCIFDADDDGKTDVVIVNTDANTISVFKNTSTIGMLSFNAGIDYATGTTPLGIAVGDINGDGKMDLVVSNSGSNNISVLLNNSTVGTISFAPQVTISIGRPPTNGIAVRDIDEDGKADIIVRSDNLYISVLRNLSTVGSVSFASKVEYSNLLGHVTDYSGSLYMSDVDGDGHVDIVATSTTITVIQNFSTPGVIILNPTGSSGNTGSQGSVMMGNIDSDDKEDFIVARNPSGLSAVRNISIPFYSFDFAIPPNIPQIVNNPTDNSSGSFRNSVAMADLNGDGKADIAVGNEGANSISVYKNNDVAANMSINGNYNFPTGTTPRSIVASDMDGDGKADLIIVNSGSNTFSVLRNTQPDIYMTSVSFTSNNADPKKVKTGETVTLSFTSNNPIQSPVVYISGQPITAINTTGNTWSATYTMQTTDAEGTVPFSITFSDLSSNIGIIDTFTTNGSFVVFDKTKPRITLIARQSPTNTFTKNTSVIFRVAISEIVTGVTIPSFQLSTTGTATGVLSGISVVGGFNNNFDITVSSVTGNGGLGLALSGTTIYDSTGNSLATTITTNNFYTIDQSLVPPTITSFSPTTAAAGSVIAITGTGFTNVTGVSIGGISAAAFTVLSSTSMNVTIGSGTSGSISITTNGGTGVIAGFTLAPTVTVTSFSPSAAGLGDNMSITGTNFTGAVAVTIGGVAVSFTVVSPTSITAIVGTGVNGSINVSSPYSTGNITGFTYLLAPTITSFTPTTALPGQPATITGTNFSSVTTVSFGGTAAASFTVLSSTSISATPAQGSSGLVRVTTTGGSASLAGFTLVPIPSISSFSPAAGTIGSSVIINGYNFNTTAGNNIVFFGTAKAVVTAASATQLTVMVPSTSGDQIITVVNLSNNLSAQSTSPFKQTFTYPSTLLASDLTNKFPLSTNGYYTAIASGDLNGDGKVDLVTASISNFVDNSPFPISLGTTVINIYKNTSDSLNFSAASFTTVTTLSSSRSTHDLRLMDMDGDGKLDLVSVDGNDDRMSVYRNTSSGGNISFGAAQALTLPSAAFAGIFNGRATLADLDSDGKPELVAIGYGYDLLKVFKNTSVAGSISFANAVSFTTTSLPQAIDIGDIDGDGKLDILLANGNSPNISIFRNQSLPGVINSTSLGSIVSFTLVNQASSQVYLRDIDNDNKADIVYAYGTQVVVMHNIATPGAISTASFEPGVAFTAPALVNDMQVADMNGDGKKDIIITSFSPLNIYVLKNTSSIGVIDIHTFDPAITAALSGVTDVHFAKMTIADFDSDGKPDVAIANSPGTYGTTTGLLNIVLNKPGPYNIPPVITSFTPTAASTGNAVTITGSNFVSVNSVSFGGTAAATFTVLSSTTISAMPANGSSGLVTVTTTSGSGSLAGFTFIVPSLPTITSFTPTAAGNGATVTITGNNFTGITGVSFGGSSATSFTTLSPTTIVAIVGAGSSGSISVTRSGNAGTLAGFVFIPPAIPPSITSITPAVLGARSGVLLTGTSFSGTTSVKFDTQPVSYYSVISPTSLFASIDTEMPNATRYASVNIVTPGGSASVSTTGMEPVISSFYPYTGVAGDTIRIKGKNLAGITGKPGIAITGAPVSYFRVDSATQITAVIGTVYPEDVFGSTAVIINTFWGTTSSGGFINYHGAYPPIISSFSPQTAASGDTVKIVGTGFDAPVAVYFGFVRTYSYTVNAAKTEITAVVPANAASGPVTVQLYYGSGGAAKDGFIYSATPILPAISSFYPASGPAGTQVFIYGSNFTNAGSVNIGNKPVASFTVLSANKISAVVAPGMTDGWIDVATSKGTARSVGMFSFKKGADFVTLSSFYPAAGGEGDTIMISGTGLGDVTSVTFGEVTAKGYFTKSNGLIGAIVGKSSASGSIRVQTAATGDIALPGFTFIPSTTQINSFFPTSAPVGETITITGVDFIDVTSVKIHGVPALSFTVLSPTTIKAVLASTQWNNFSDMSIISVKARGGLASIAGFGIMPPPTISSYTYERDDNGLMAVEITGTNFSDITHLVLGGGPASYSVTYSTKITGLSDITTAGYLGLTPWTILVESPSGIATVTVPALPKPSIRSVTPDTAYAGTNVTIRGSNLKDIKTLFIAGAAASSYTLVGDTLINAIAGNIPRTLPLTNPGLILTTKGGKVTLPNPVNGYTWNLKVPKINSFNPVTGSKDSVITIRGSDFTGVTKVQFGNADAKSFVVDSAGQIRAVVDTGSSGAIRVVTPGGTATLNGFSYIVPSVVVVPLPLTPVVTTAPATIVSFSPAAATAGTAVIITGTNFTGVTNVRFGDIAASSFTVTSSTQITAVVANGASGNVYVTSTGTTVSLSGFNFIPAAPTITASSPITFCDGLSVLLTSSNTTYDNQWYKNGVLISGNKTNTLKVTQAGTYTVTAGNNGFVSSPSAGTTTTVITAPVIAKPKINGFLKDTLICFTDALALSVDGTYDKYLWSTGETTRAISVTKQANITVKVGSSNATCYSADSSFTIDARKNITPVPTLTRNNNDLISSISDNYRWSLNNVFINGANTATLPIGSKGVYNVSTSKDNTCWTASADYLILLDPATIKKAFDLTSYPNPSNGTFSIQIKFEKAISAVVNITITDQLGVVKLTAKKILFSDRTLKIPVSIGLTKGTYSVRVDVNGEINTQQMIVL